MNPVSAIETKNCFFLSFASAYHGHVSSVMDISPYKLKTNVDGMHPIPSNVYVVSINPYATSNFCLENVCFLPLLHNIQVHLGLDFFMEANNMSRGM